MPKNVMQYDLLISCPGDIVDEIVLIDKAVEQFNQLYSDTLEIMIRTRHWKKSSYTQSGDKPQNLLNTQFVNDCDAAVAIFWTRFGSPTDKYGSGTEEEIISMLEQGKQVFMYFCNKPVAPSDIDTEGYRKVQQFKESYQSKGLYYQYSSNEDFEKQFFAHLSQYFLTHQHEENSAKQNMSELTVCGINQNGEPCETGDIRHFIPRGFLSIKDCQGIIVRGLQEATNIHLKEEKPVRPLFAELNLLSKVEIDREVQEKLCKFAKTVGVDLPDDFFVLGGLKKQLGVMSKGPGYVLEGTEEEKRKYKLISSCGRVIDELKTWAVFEESYGSLLSLNLGISNSGTKYDEDVEVILHFDKEAFLLPNEFPDLPYYTKEFLCSDCDINEIFSIESSAHILNYSLSQQGNNQSISEGHPRIVINHDYDELFEEQIKDTFDYSFYPVGKQIVVKVNFDYIKHNTIVAFPTPLFLKQHINEIHYSITSKHNPQKQEGVFVIEDDDKK